MLSLIGFQVVTLLHMDQDAASTPGQRKVYQKKIREREADLKARGCCHDALSVLQKIGACPHPLSVGERQTRYHQCTNIECSATFRTTEAIDEFTRPPAEPVTPQHPVKCRAATAHHTAINQRRTDHDYLYITAGL